MKAHRVNADRTAFWCPGCDEAHVVNRSWTFNGNHDRPTFYPSIKVTGTQPITDEEHAALMAGGTVKPRPRCCHSFVTDGRIRFLSDCTHALAGQTVDLPEWPTGAEA